MDGSRFEFPDEDLRFRIESYLKSRHFPEFEYLDVSVDNGSVTLSGRLQSYYEKQVALSSCQRVAGVIRLVDEVRVSGRTPKLVITTS